MPCRRIGKYLSDTCAYDKQTFGRHQAMASLKGRAYASDCGVKRDPLSVFKQNHRQTRNPDMMVTMDKGTSVPVYGVGFHIAGV